MALSVIRHHPPVKNCMILLEQSFTARMPLLTATSAFWIREKTLEFSSTVLPAHSLHIYQIFFHHADKTSPNSTRQLIEAPYVPEQFTMIRATITLITTLKLLVSSDWGQLTVETEDSDCFAACFRRHAVRIFVTTSDVRSTDYCAGSILRAELIPRINLPPASAPWMYIRPTIGLHAASTVA